MEAETSLGKKVMENLQRKCENMYFDRVPFSVSKPFKSFSFNDFAGDHGMTLKQVWEDRIRLLDENESLRKELERNSETSDMLRELLDLLKTTFQMLSILELRIQNCEQKEKEPETIKKVRMADGSLK
jgi:chromosome condensin MukBEF complex kleisin-like MukF subunit